MGLEETDIVGNSLNENCVLPWRLRNTAGLVLLLRASISPFQVVVYSNIPELIGQSTTLESNRPTGSCFTGYHMESIRSSIKWIIIILCSCGHHTVMFSRLLLPAEANLVVLTDTVNRISLLPRFVVEKPRSEKSSQWHISFRNHLGR
jgi:hypothetical protein